MLVMYELCFGSQKYNDFLESVYESISKLNIQENGKPRWTQEKVLELVSGQVVALKLPSDLW